MKLGDFIDKHMNISDVQEDFEKLNLHVVPECGDCEYWGAKFQKPDGVDIPAELVKELEQTHRLCDQEDSPVILSPKDFGCTHGKPRQ